MLVVENKWMNVLEERMIGEVDRLSQKLAGRVKELAERYAEPMSTLISETESLAKKVDEHLLKMGFSLN